MTWAFMSVYIVIAILLSVGASVAVFMMAFNKRIAPDVLLLLGAATAGALTFFTSHRDLSLTKEALLEMGNETWLLRFANLGALGLCAVATVQVALKGAVSRTSVIVAVATLQYYFICFLMPVSFDRWYVFDHRLLYPIASLVIIIMPTTLTVRQLGIAFARIATIPMFLSLVLIPINHNAAVLDSYDSLLPFFPGRLYGATSHPNVLGSVAAFAILLLCAFPPRRREFILLFTINIVALLLCQSKTSWVTLLLCLGILYIPRIRQFRGRVPAPVLVGLFLVLTAIPAAASVYSHAIYTYLAGNQNVADVTTLTGRVDIWRATLFLIMQHLITGPGYATYIVYMQSLFPDLVANPHNLYLATMVQAGLVGLASLVIFLITLLIASSLLYGRARMFAFAYLVLICARGISEAFLFQDAFTSALFWHALMFMRLLAVASAEQRGAAAPGLPVSGPPPGLVAQAR